MKINCVWEHNCNDTLLWAVDFPGAFSRGETKDIAISKIRKEINSYCIWANISIPTIDKICIVQDLPSNLDIKDADSDVLFENEKTVLIMQEYTYLKELALKSAADFLSLYNSIPEKTLSNAPYRKTFYGEVPHSAKEMYNHTKNVNEYYFGEIGVDADNDGNILECRKRGFEILEKQENFLSIAVLEGNYGEMWSLKKVFRRFIWHDRIHAKAMYKMATKIWGSDTISNIFKFDIMNSKTF